MELFMANILSSTYDAKKGTITLIVATSSVLVKSSTGKMDLFVSGGFAEVPNLVVENEAGQKKQVKAMIQIGVDSAEKEEIKQKERQSKAKSAGL
jgi:hypothetical protein